MNTAQATELRPRVAVTLGDPAGVGPELIAKLLSRPENVAAADILLISDETELRDAGEDAKCPIEYVTEPTPGKPLLYDNSAGRPVEVFERRAATEAGGRWALGNLRHALELAKKGDVDAILFAPLNKSSLHLAGMRENDELRWFEIILGAEDYTSELNVLPGLWTARVTSHVSLAEVDAGITRENVAAAGRLLDKVLRESGIAAPRIGVCALNPHAGENGKFGRHELDIIAPAIGDMERDGIDAKGPFPSDTIFLRAKAGDFDGILTMYHDQGQIAMKLMGFDGGVTVAGGLSVPICTPAHGTAFDVVGKGIATTGSIQNAFDLAVKIGARRRAASSL
ncbi:4-hydroxythreonine-4-phosphate dehydrogenase PdxA [Streptomyces himalayensis]|uniref:4-hydroxythreonine-4-phosphate dehydrogenase PdxA n=1 Tax=Streptomyces himalayensis subsp. himalayensis TaxID=2756131 RepID=A0A7W0DK07_9ACTN|nr:4-hydroxythreonine-4-phosphate dehydrogenase PdxA [Streptomyces himalayensis]MBA2945789.1 4-hydroxythreonine-4-phosphate dehydrogenase PdxA [Streptomyces himalayensis subsp. himalayensis]